MNYCFFITIGVQYCNLNGYTVWGDSVDETFIENEYEIRFSSCKIQKGKNWKE